MIDLQVVTYVDRPDLDDRWDDTVGTAWPEFLMHDATVNEFWPHLFEIAPEHQFFVVDPASDAVVCVGNSIPFRWDRDPTSLPDGIDGVLPLALEQYAAGVEPNPLCALQAIVVTGYQGRGHAPVPVRAMADAARRAGFVDLVAPVRPSWKHRFPLIAMDEYATWSRPDGLPFDPWLRVQALVTHPECLGVRSGGAADKIRVMSEAGSRALMNANVVTPVAGPATEIRRARALLTRDGTIAAVGSEDEVRERASAGTEFADMQGRTIVPGFVDAHIHPIFYGLSLEGVPCLPPRVNSITDLRREVRLQALRADDGEWVWGQGYDDTRLAEGRHPTRQDLDEPAAGRPVVLTRVCGHMCVANSRALEVAGVDASTPDPPGGRIERDRSGEPTGLLLETAEALVLRHVTSGRERVLRALRRVSDDLLRHGITACCDAWLGYSEGAAEPDIWAEALASGAFQPGISFLVHHGLWHEAAADAFDPSLHVLGVKLVSDGSISGGSAGLEDAFLGDEDHRLLVFDPEELREICRDVSSRGLVVAIHAMGDRAIAMALDAIEATRDGEGPRDPSRPADRIEHCTLPNRADIDRLARLGVSPVMQPTFLFAEGEAYLRKLGTDRSHWANPARAMIDAGVRVALSSDAPATTWGEPTDVMLGIQASVARRTWAGSSLGTAQSTTVAEALVGYTANAAAAAGLGGDQGTIEAGMRADLAVLSDDLLQVPIEEMQNVRVVATMLAGELVFGEL